jgi:hypothetical protein
MTSVSGQRRDLDRTVGDDLIDSGIVDWVFEGPLAAEFGYTQGDLGILARVLCRPCPRCHAAPGVWCRTPNGRELVGLDAQHTTRRHHRPH